MKAREARRRAGLPTLLSLSRTRSRRAYVGGHGGHRRLSQGSSGGRAGDTERSWGTVQQAQLVPPQLGGMEEGAAALAPPCAASVGGAPPRWWWWACG